MTCPTCDGTMHFVGEGDIRIYHCVRCGTLVTERDGKPSAVGRRFVATPSLVTRCRKFEARLSDGSLPLSRWVQDGIPEAINLPADRLTD